MLKIQFIKLDFSNLIFQNSSTDQQGVYLIIALKYSSTETYLVTGLSMIAEVGGMAGLLLGVSFFHTTKLIEFFINMKIEKLQGGRSGLQTET